MSNMSEEKNILNYIQINKRIATSGQPAPAEFQSIAKAGYNVVINLAMPDSTNALPDEGGFVTESGLNYCHLPVPFEAPTLKHLLLFFKLMKALEDEKIWVHCALNWRVSAFMQHYQKLVLNLPEVKRVAMIKDWKPDPVWQDFLKLEINLDLD